jgi:outer membrane protein assembly factor BamB
MTQFSLGGFASTSRISGFVLNCLVALGWLTISGHPLHAASLDEDRARNWHQWRGPEANGVSRTAKPPVEWSETKNVQWKVAIPGSGSSTPIIWGDKVFLLTSINTGKVDPSLPKPEDQPKRVFGITHPNTAYEYVVLCLDRASGQELWRRKATNSIPPEGHHGDNNFASASPVTDGERLHCWFGSAGLFTYDLDGRKLWERDLGKVKMGASLGEGSSPALHDGKLVIVRDHQGQSTISTLDAKSGATLWKENRDEGNTWATPLIVNHAGRAQVITPGSKKIRSYDLRTGQVLWQCGGLTGNAIPCPVVEGNLVYCMTGYEGHALLALPLSAAGDLSDSDQIAWSQRRGTPYIPSPVLYDGLLWFNQSNQSLWSCLDARTGEVLLDRARLPGLFNLYSSPVAAAGRLYVTDRTGTTLVLKRAKDLQVLATNKLDDSFAASPALAGTQLFLRGGKFLYCLAEKR